MPSFPKQDIHQNQQEYMQAQSHVYGSDEWRLVCYQAQWVSDPSQKLSLLPDTTL